VNQLHFQNEIISFSHSRPHETSECDADGNGEAVDDEKRQSRRRWFSILICFAVSASLFPAKQQTQVKSRKIESVCDVNYCSLLLGLKSKRKQIKCSLKEMMTQRSQEMISDD